MENEKYANIQLAIVEDDTMVAQLLKNHIERDREIDVQYVVNSGNKFFQKLKETTKHPDIVLLDLRMQHGNGLEVLEMLSKEAYSIKTIVMTSHYSISFVGQMIRLGCNAFLPKDIDPDELIVVIKEVAHRGHYFTEEQLEIMRKQINPKSPKLHIETKESLSPRELEVLSLIAQQLTTKEIGERLFISYKTVEMHKSKLLSKTGTRNSAGLIMYAIKNKLIDPDNFMLLE
jgi:DNA-binding NarL/FixJ family response regulator